MQRFVLAIEVPFLAALCFAAFTHGRFGVLQASEGITLILTLGAAPTIAAMGAASLVHLRRPRRWLDPRCSSRLQVLLLGLFAGTVAMALCGITIFYLNQPLWSDNSYWWDGSDHPPVESTFILPFSGTPWWWDGWFDQKRLPDAFIIALCTFLCTLPAVWIMPLRRPGRCAKCNYDVRYSLHTDRCPECGTAVMQA